MENITTEQKNRLVKLEGVRINPQMALFEVAEEIRDSLREIASKELPQMKMPQFPDVLKVELPGVQLITIKGEPGKDFKYEDLTPEQKEELKGEEGKDYILTEFNKKEIASKITVPIVEKIIEKTEVIHEQPIVTNEVKEVAVAESAEQIREKLESLKEEDRLDASAIKNLDEKFKEVETKINAIPRGGGRASHSMKLYPLTPNGITKVFSVPKSVTGYLVTSDFPNVLFESTSTKDNGFSINPTRTQLTTTPDNAISDGAQLIYVYSEYFNS